MDLVGETERDLFFIITAVLLAFSLYQSIGLAAGTDVPVVSVVSNSMVPTFHRGDMVVVQGTPFEEIEEDDIVVFDSKFMPMPVIHRVINRSNGTIDTRGDANPGQVRFCVDGRRIRRFQGSCGPGEELVNIEKDVRPEQIRGRVEAIIPYLGYAKLLPVCLVRSIQYPADHPAVRFACSSKGF